MKHRLIHGVVVAILLVTPLGAMADWGFLGKLIPKHHSGVEPVSNSRYQSECSACHFAYPPGLLPQRSWQKLLEGNALANHFGEDAELSDDTRQQILTYAVTHAADTSGYKRSRKVMASTPADETPLRITEVRYIRRKHADIPKEWITGNPKVGSLSNCDACHTKAAQGIFDSDTVFIKGHGPWH